MLTRVVAKQAKKTKVKNKFVNGKKKFKRTLSCLFGGRGKVNINIVGAILDEVTGPQQRPNP